MMTYFAAQMDVAARRQVGDGDAGNLR